MKSPIAKKQVVPVFRLYQPSEGEPAYCVERGEALRMVRDGLAFLINRGRAIRLAFQNPQHLRDESCKIGPQTMHAYATGSERAIAAVDVGWGENRILAECLAT